MKVEQIKAFKSNDGCIWESESEAIVQNIEECIGFSGLSHGDTYTVMVEKLRNWFLNHPGAVRYIQANIKKV